MLLLNGWVVFTFSLNRPVIHCVCVVLHRTIQPFYDQALAVATVPRQLILTCKALHCTNDSSTCRVFTRAFYFPCRFTWVTNPCVVRYTALAFELLSEQYKSTFSLRHRFSGNGCLQFFFPPKEEQKKKMAILLSKHILSILFVKFFLFKRELIKQSQMLDCFHFTFSSVILEALFSLSWGVGVKKTLLKL